MVYPRHFVGLSSPKPESNFKYYSVDRPNGKITMVLDDGRRFVSVFDEQVLTNSPEIFREVLVSELVLLI